jgi:hypothetical protein
MAPLEDRSQVIVNISMPEGATYEMSLAFNDEIAQTPKKLCPTMSAWAYLH